MVMVATVKNARFYLANISVVHTKVLESPTTKLSLLQSVTVTSLTKFGILTHRNKILEIWNSW